MSLRVDTGPSVSMYTHIHMSGVTCVCIDVSPHEYVVVHTGWGSPYGCTCVYTWTHSECPQVYTCKSLRPTHELGSPEYVCVKQVEVSGRGEGGSGGDIFEYEGTCQLHDSRCRHMCVCVCEWTTLYV